MNPLASLLLLVGKMLALGIVIVFIGCSPIIFGSAASRGNASPPVAAQITSQIIVITLIWLVVAVAWTNVPERVAKAYGLSTASG